MERLLSNTSIDIEKKLVACKNAFYIAESSDQTPVNEKTLNCTSELIKKIRHGGVDSIALKWLVVQLDVEIKPPTLECDNEPYKLEKQQREKLWSCLVDICVSYPNTAESIFLALKPLPCEFFVKSISEGMEPGTPLSTQNLIIQWVLSFMLGSENVHSTLFRQPLLYNQGIAKLLKATMNISDEHNGRNHYDSGLVLRHYKAFLRQIHDNIADGRSLDLDSIEGNFIEVALPALMDGISNETGCKSENTISYGRYDAKTCEMISDILQEVLFKREHHISDWKDFLYSLTVSDRKPCPKSDHIEKLLYFLNQNSQDKVRVLQLLPFLFNAFCKATIKEEGRKEGINAINGFTLKECTLFFVMCCHILKIGPPTESSLSPIILDTSLAACKLPHFIDQESEFGERLDVLAILIRLLTCVAPASSIISVEFNTSKDDNLESTLSLLMWLKLSLKHIIEKDRPENVSSDECCVVTERRTGVIMALMKLDSRIVESLIGSVLANVLFQKVYKCHKIHVATPCQSNTTNSQESDCKSSQTCQTSKSLFIKELLLTYAKLRQIPKLVAKFFLCLEIKDSITNETEKDANMPIYPLTANVALSAYDLENFGHYISKIPSGQLIELFKTFIYQIELIKTPVSKARLTSQNDLKSEYYTALLNLADQLIPCFLENATVSDHSIPIATKEKFVQLMIKMDDDIKSKFKSDFDLIQNVIQSLARLSSLMLCYDPFDSNTDLKKGLENIEQSRNYTNGTKLLENLSLYGAKRKSTPNQIEDKKRRKKSMDVPTVDSEIFNDELNMEDWSVQNEVINNLEAFSEDDIYKLAKQTLRWVQNIVKSDHFDCNVWIAPSWLSTLIAENVFFQNAMIQVGIEMFQAYFKDGAALPGKAQELYQNMCQHSSSNTEKNCQLISKCKKERKVGEAVSCRCQICQIAQKMEFLLSPENLMKRSKYRLTLKEEDQKTFAVVFGTLIPLENIQSSSEAIMSMFLTFLLTMCPMSNDVAFQKYIVIYLLKCWDTTYRLTNILWYLPFGKLLRAICKVENSLNLGDEVKSYPMLSVGTSFQERLPLTSQLSKIGISLQSSSLKSNPLLDLNEGTLENVCSALESFFDSKETKNSNSNLMQSDAICAVILMQSIETHFKYVASNSKSATSKKLPQEKSKNIAYFNALSKSFLASLKQMKNLKQENVTNSAINADEDISKNKLNNFEKMIVMIRGASAYLTVQRQSEVTLDAKVLLSNTHVAHKRLKYLVDFALALISSIFEKATENDRKYTKLCDVKQCFGFLHIICKHQFEFLSQKEKSDNASNPNQIMVIWKSLLNSQFLNLFEEKDSSMALACIIEQYESELFETILSNTKDKLVFKDLVNTLLERLRSELKSKDQNRPGFNRLINIIRILATVPITAIDEGSNEPENHSEIRRIALESTIELLQHNSSYEGLSDDGKINNEILSMLRLEKTLIEVSKPLLKSQCEAILLRTSTLLRLDSIVTLMKKSITLEKDASMILQRSRYFIDAWQLICGILSSALYKRPSYLVKSRVTLIISVFRNLLFGLTAISDQNLYSLTKDNQTHSNSLPTNQCAIDIEELENMSHNLDRCLDLIRGDKLKEDFARVAPYMIADILEAGFAGRVTVIHAVKKNLLSGMYKLLDICAKHSIDYLVNTLPIGQQDVFKEIVGNYKQYHKYSGKV